MPLGRHQMITESHLPRLLIPNLQRLKCQIVPDIFNSSQIRGCCPIALTAWCYHDLPLFLPSLTPPLTNVSSPRIINQNLMLLTASLHSTANTKEESTGCSHSRMWVVDQEKRSELRANLGHRITCTVRANLKRQRTWSVHIL